MMTDIILLHLFDIELVFCGDVQQNPGNKEQNRQPRVERTLDEEVGILQQEISSEFLFIQVVCVISDVAPGGEEFVQDPNKNSYDVITKDERGWIVELRLLNFKICVIPT